MASVKKRVGKRGTTYRLTIYKGYLKGKQIKEVISCSLKEMGIDELSEKGNPRAERTIMKEVKLYADNLEKRLTTAEYGKGDKVKLIDFYENSWKPWAKNHYSDSSYYTYTSHIEQIILPEIGSLKIGKITPEHLSKIYEKLTNEGRIKGSENGFAKGSIITYHKQIKSVFRLAKNYKIIEENPCENVEFPEIDNSAKIKYFTKEQAVIFINEVLENPAPCVVEAFYKEWGKTKTSTYDFCAREISKHQFNTYKVLFHIALYSGCRIGELLALTWQDINFDSCTLSIKRSVAYAKSKGGQYIKTPKTKNSYREIIIPENEICLLKKLKKEQLKNILKLGTAWNGESHPKKINNNMVFTQYDGSMMCRSTPNRVLHRLIKNYNAQNSEDKQLPLISMHSLRHTSATLLIAMGMDIEEISSRLGHKNIQTTLSVYAHPLKMRDKQASEILDYLINDRMA